MAKRIRVVTSTETGGAVVREKPRVVVSDNPSISRSLTKNEIMARAQRKYATSSTFGGLGYVGRY